MKGVQGNQAAQVRMFAHDAIPVAIGAINKENGITVDSGGYGYKVGDEEALTVASGTAATIKVTGVGKQDIINVQANGGNFYFNGEQKPAITLNRGTTYVFYQKAQSNGSSMGAGHPLKFSETLNGTGGEYTSGVTQNDLTAAYQRVVTFTVPLNAPDTLFYYCPNHINMGNTITIQDSGDDFFDTFPNNNAIRTVEIVRAAGATPFGKGYTIGEQVQTSSESFNTDSPSAFIFKVASIDLSSTIDRGACLYVAEKLATLELKTESDEYVTFKNIPAGTFMPVLAKEIKTATLDSSGNPTIGENDVIALY